MSFLTSFPGFTLVLRPIATKNEYEGKPGNEAISFLGLQKQVGPVDFML